jgi:hypothetical protein
MVVVGKQVRAVKCKSPLLLVATREAVNKALVVDGHQALTFMRSESQALGLMKWLPLLSNFQVVGLLWTTGSDGGPGITTDMPAMITALRRERRSSSAQAGLQLTWASKER